MFIEERIFLWNMLCIKPQTSLEPSLICYIAFLFYLSPLTPFGPGTCLNFTVLGGKGVGVGGGAFLQPFLSCLPSSCCSISHPIMSNPRHAIDMIPSQVTTNSHYKILQPSFFIPFDIVEYPTLHVFLLGFFGPALASLSTGLLFSFLAFPHGLADHTADSKFLVNLNT